MAGKLKVYRMNYDGTNERMVAAGSIREAATLLGTTPHQFRNYGGIEDRESFVSIAVNTPREVWQRKMHFGPASGQPPWVMIPCPGRA